MQEVEKSFESARILVVDDNAENRALAQATLKDEGYEVVLAESGEAALRICAHEPPDCVLLDVRMPGMTGFEVCARIRAMPEGATIPVVFLTALRDLDTFDAALRAGGDDFLTKPVRPAELLVRVRSALKLRRFDAELREHVDLVRKQRDDLMRLQLQKERLSAFVVHDLKNPVSSMDLLAQMLLRNRELPQSARSSVQRIRDEAGSLLRLIYNLLDISRSEEGQLVAQRAPLDLRALMRAIVDELEPKARDAGVRIVHAVEVDGLFAADEDLLRRVLENLIENALRYAPEQTAVHVAARADAAHVEISVADAGQGIALELRGKVFERFVQVNTSDPSSVRGGRGLGLTFCKLAVEAHGGTIWIEDAQPGAVFRIKFPK